MLFGENVKKNRKNGTQKNRKWKKKAVRKKNRGKRYNMINPASLMKMMNVKNTLSKNHPRFEAFIKNVVMGNGGIPAGTVIELTVTKPGEDPVTTNIRVQQSDLDALASMKDLQQ